MGKPLFRWTVGPCLDQGLEIVAESIQRTTAALGVGNWDWVVCYNGLNPENLQFLRGSVGSLPIQFYCQDWAMCAVNDHMQNPRRKDGSFEWDGKKCGGTMWKVTPPRMRMESHEIIMDNDVIIMKKFPQIDEWLAQTSKALVLEEPIQFYGRYESEHDKNPPYLNSGFIGLPPGYDYGAEIYKHWARLGRYTNISQADEQGLLTYTLIQSPNMRIKADQVVEILGRDFSRSITGDEPAYHFTQANRMPKHRAWIQYQNLKRNGVFD